LVFGPQSSSAATIRQLSLVGAAFVCFAALGPFESRAPNEAGLGRRKLRRRRRSSSRGNGSSSGGGGPIKPSGQQSKPIDYLLSPMESASANRLRQTCGHFAPKVSPNRAEPPATPGARFPFYPAGAGRL